MLDALRRLGRTWIGKIVGVFLIIGLAGFGISNVIFDFGSNVVARVGSEDITTQEFSRAYQQQINSVANQLGYTPTAEQALQMGIPSTVISGLATEAAIGQTTNKLGLGVSDAKLRDIIQSNSNFFSMLGRFDRDIFNQVLQSSGYTEAEYVELERRQARRDQFETGLLGGSYTSQTARDLVNHHANDKRIIEYFTLDAASLDPVAVPTDDELAAYLKEHQTEFRTLEARTADVLVFTPDILAAQRVPTDEQVKAEYDRTKDQLVKIEKRHIQQVSMPTEGTARWFEIKRDAGTSFEDALKESGLTATDLGTLSKAEVTDPALGDAAFGLAKAGDFTVIAGIGSRRLVAVTDIQPGGPVTFDEAKADIATRLALEAAKAEYTDVQDQIEELRAAFRPIKEIADRFKLPLANVTLNSDGAALSAVNGIAAENRARVAAAIFGAQEGKLSAAVTFGATNNVYFDLGKVEVARDQTLDEVRDAVTKAITDQRTATALEAEAKSVVADMDSGVSVGVLASQHNKEATTSDPIGRNGNSGASALGPAVTVAVFELGPNGNGSALSGAGTYTVFHIANILPTETPSNEQTTKLVEDATRQALYAEFVTGLRESLPFSINQQALNSVLALDTAQ